MPSDCILRVPISAVQAHIEVNKRWKSRCACKGGSFEGGSACQDPVGGRDLVEELSEVIGAENGKTCGRACLVRYWPC